MAIWDDDGIVCRSLQSRLTDIVRYLEKVFEMTYGDLECFVAIQIKRNRERTWKGPSRNFTWRAAIPNLYRRIRMQDCPTM